MKCFCFTVEDNIRFLKEFICCYITFATEIPFMTLIS